MYFFSGCLVIKLFHFHFHFGTDLFSLEGSYLFQQLSATIFLFYRLLALNYLFQKSPSPLEIKWWPPNTRIAANITDQKQSKQTVA